MATTTAAMAMIQMGSIPTGYVSDMALRALCLCDGYGGFELGLREHGVRTVARVERDSHAAAVLVERMEESRLDQAPVWDDLTTFDGAAWRGCVDIITAGFPCQPFSAAGQRLGVDDERWLWPDIARIIADVGPRFVFLENVTGLVRHGLPYVLADLAELGFDAEWGLYSAADVGAPHRRQRFWLLAVAHDNDLGLQSVGRLQPRLGSRGVADRSSSADVADAESQRDGSGIGPATWPAGWEQRSETRGRAFPPRPDDTDRWAEWSAEGGPQPSVRRGVDGRPVGLADTLHLGGNGLVPDCATEAFRQLANRFQK